MKQRLFIIPFLMMVWMLGSAQSPAAKIKEIQKDTKTYVYAESTSPTEDEAYVNALRQLTDMAINYVYVNADGARIDDASIMSLAEKITIPRGDFHRVFLYVSREDLLSRSKSLAVSEENEGDTQAEVVLDDSDSNPVSEGLQVDTNEKQEEEIEISVPEEILTAVMGQEKITGMAAQMINDILRAKDLKEAAKIVNDYKNMRVVENYGVSRDVRNSSASFWIVEDNNGGLTVLGPEIKGYRNNYKTGKADALYRYSRGMWFRRR